jgi:hypothetical protein
MNILKDQRKPGLKNEIKMIDESKGMKEEKEANMA